MRAAGASCVVCVVKEDVGSEVADFRAGYWAEEIFLDKEQRFFTALGGGQPHRPYSGVAAFLAMLANPFSTARTKGSLKRAKAKGVTGNTTGEGMIAGGVYVVRADGLASYTFLEEDVGDHAPVEDVIEAVKAAVRGEVFALAPSETFLGDAGDGAQASTSRRRKTWKEFAGRTTGSDSYQFGDLTQGLLPCSRRPSPA